MMGKHKIKYKMIVPVITVVTPCYNAECFIRETIESVINQIFSQWEMNIVDDCSTDSSAEIIKGYSLRDPRIHYYRTQKPSGSPSLPRNWGIKVARGEYVAFLDSDDIWLPHKLESQYAFIVKSGAEFVYSYYSRFIDNCSCGGVIKSPQYARYKDICKRDFIPMLTIMVKKSVLKGVEFGSRPKDDFVFLLKLLRKGIVAYNTNEDVARYRIVQQSRSVTN